MSAPAVRRGVRWAGRVLAALGLAVLLLAAGLWWWSGQEGSLEWALKRAAPGELQAEGVRGALRSGWHIERLVWERGGLRVVAEDVRLRWQPNALVEQLLRLDEVRVASLAITQVPQEDDEPFRPPPEVALPWRVVVDELSVDRLLYRGAGGDVDARALAGRYAFDGRHHQATLRSLELGGGSYQGEARLLAVPPMTLQLQLQGRFATQVPGLEAPVPLQFEATAEGPLEGFEARARLHVPQEGIAGSELPRATATARITPFAEMPVPRASATFRQLDLEQFWPAAPQTRLSGQLEVAPMAGANWRIEADLRNALPGPWDANRLPLAELRGQGEWRGGTALLRELRGRLGGGTVEGSGAWGEQGGWRFEGSVSGVDPSQLHTELAALPLSGPVALAGEEGDAVAFDVALQAAPGARRRPTAGGEADDPLLAALGALELREARAKGRWAGRALTLAPLLVRTSEAVLEGRLEVDLQARAGEGQLQLRAPGLRAEGRGALAERRGEGRLQLTATDLGQAQAWLRRFPHLREALAGVALQGRGEARLAWKGGWTDPAVEGRVQAARLRLGGEGGQPAWELREVQADIDGRLSDAAVALRANAVQGQRTVALTAAGQVAGTLAGPPASWRGRVAELALQVRDPQLAPGPWRLELTGPVVWRHAEGDLRVEAGTAVLRAPPMAGGAPASEAVLRWEPIRRTDGTLVTAGRLHGLPLAWLELLGVPQLAGPGLSGDLVFDATWQARLGDTVQVQAQLERVGGDLTVLAEGAEGAAARVRAGVREARLTLRSEGEQLVASFEWDSARAGRAQGQVRTRLARSPDGGWTWPEQAPLEGRIQAELPRIGVWSLLAPPGWRLRGSLAADLRVAGTRADPQLSGPVTADDLALRSVVEGVELRDGRLRARLEGRRLVVEEFVLQGSDEGGGGGTLVAYGEGRLTPGGPVLQAQARLSQLRASLRSDRQLTLSGPLQARMGPEGTTITGELRVDRARIEMPEEAAPRLGEDVVVRNAAGAVGAAVAGGVERAARAAVPGTERNVRLDVSIDLGDDFRVTGRGIETRLAGTLQVQGRSLEQPRLVGTIRTVGGTFEGYGQRMQIERGELRFTGPVDNPSLDVLAIRPNIDERVGLQITGRAQSPVIELYSASGLSEAETLSWLVLGRSTAAGGAETALLQRAAGALLAGRGGGPGLAQRLGLDDISLAREADGDGAVVRVGKRFADNFYAAYERSLSGAMGTLYIFYDVSRRLTVRAEAGERTGLDLIFTFAFDRVRRR